MLACYPLARRLWKDYLTTVDGVVFIVDALDQERFPEAKRELDVSRKAWQARHMCVQQPADDDPASIAQHTHTQGLLTSDELANVPFLVLGNKIDVARAVSEEQLRYSLGLQNTYGKEVSHSSSFSFLVVQCSAHDVDQSYTVVASLKSQNTGEKQPGVRPIELYMCSVIKRMGYADGRLTCVWVHLDVYVLT